MKVTQTVAEILDSQPLKHPERLPLEKVYIGPTSNKIISWLGFHKFLMERKYENAVIIFSEIPIQSI